MLILHFFFLQNNKVYTETTEHSVFIQVLLARQTELTVNKSCDVYKNDMPF